MVITEVRFPLIRLPCGCHRSYIAARCIWLMSAVWRKSENPTDADPHAYLCPSSIQAAVYGRDPNWGRIACAAGYAGVPFNPEELNIRLGQFELMDKGQPIEFDRQARFLLLFFLLVAARHRS